MDERRSCATHGRNRYNPWQRFSIFSDTMFLFHPLVTPTILSFSLQYSSLSLHSTRHVRSTTRHNGTMPCGRVVSDRARSLYCLIARGHHVVKPVVSTQLQANKHITSRIISYQVNTSAALIPSSPVQFMFNVLLCH